MNCDSFCQFVQFQTNCWKLRRSQNYDSVGIGIDPALPGAPTIGHVKHFGHLPHRGVQLRLCVLDLRAELVEHDGLLVQLGADLTRDVPQVAHRVRHHAELLILREQITHF